MFRLSNCFFLFFNFTGLISGCFAIGSSLYFQKHGITQCQQFIHNQLMVLGIIFVAISLLGLLGAILQSTFLLAIYSFVAFFVILSLTAFTIFVYMVENPSARKDLSAIGFKEYSLSDYSQWLKNMVADGKAWKSIRTCLINHQACKRVDVKKVEDFYTMKLSPIESGCCKPPTYCRFEHKNATFWMVPEAGVGARGTDCALWSNDVNERCYDCNSCKAGVIEMSRIIWRIVAILDVIDVAIVIIIFGLSCSIRNSILSDKKYNRIHA